MCRVPSDRSRRLCCSTMATNRDETQGSWDEFARRHLGLLVTVLLRVVARPEIAFDLAVETLAMLRRQWSERPVDDEERLICAVQSCHALLADAASRGVVPR